MNFTIKQKDLGKLCNEKYYHLLRRGGDYCFNYIISHNKYETFEELYNIIENNYIVLKYDGGIFQEKYLNKVIGTWCESYENQDPYAFISINKSSEIPYFPYDITFKTSIKDFAKYDIINYGETNILKVFELEGITEDMEISYEDVKNIFSNYKLVYPYTYLDDGYYKTHTVLSSHNQQALLIKNEDYEEKMKK